MARTQSRDVPRSGMQACEVRRGGHRGAVLLIERCAIEGLAALALVTFHVDVPTSLAPALIMIIFDEGRDSSRRGVVHRPSRAISARRICRLAQAVCDIIMICAAFPACMPAHLHDVEALRLIRGDSCRNPGPFREIDSARSFYFAMQQLSGWTGR